MRGVLRFEAITCKLRVATSGKGWLAGCLLSIDRAGQIVSIKAGDAEVAAQVEQVNGAQVAGDGDQSEAPWGLREDNRAA